MTYMDFKKVVDERVKSGEKKAHICLDYGIYPQKLVYYMKASKKNPDKMIPVELNEKMKLK